MLVLASGWQKLDVSQRKEATSTGLSLNVAQLGRIDVPPVINVINKEEGELS